jgi:FkbM family methyltransferase
MNFQQLSARAAQRFGHEHPIIRTLRPIYEGLLDLATGGRGFQRTINACETFFIDPRHRGLFPETYEPSTYEYLRHSLKPGSVCLDVGAHVGIYALSLARWSGPNGKVFAFEPSPETRAVLESNVRRNRFAGRIRVIPKGVSDLKSEATFFAADLAGFSRLGEPNPERPEDHKSFTVSLTTIDDFCSEQSIQPDWILIDIEGYEVAALKGAGKTIEAGHGKLSIVVEMHPFLWDSAGTSKEEFASLFALYGLKARALSGQKDLWAENGQIALEYL